MDYSKIYEQLISKFQKNVAVGYSENHHIFPSCQGGHDIPVNKVRLPPREHFIAHLLLVKMNPGFNKLIHAAHMMSNMKIYGSRKYAWLREAHAKIMSERPVTKETRDKMSIAKTGVPRSLETRQKISDSKNGKPLSEQHRSAISAGGLKRFIENPVSADTRQKLSDARRGMAFTEEWKKNIGKASKGRIAGGAKFWVLIDPAGSERSVYCLKQFSEENNLNWKVLVHAAKRGEAPVSRGPSKGWRISRPLVPPLN